MIRRILVGLSGSPCTSACIQAAVDLADQHGAELTGVAAVNVKRLVRVGSLSLAGDSIAQEIRRHRIELSSARADEVADQFRHACRAAELKWSIHREEQTTPLECLICQGRYHDLVILGLQGVFDYGVVGEAHDDGGLQILQLIRSGVRPVLAVGPSYRRIRRAMIAYSGSSESAHAMKQFIQLLSWPEVNVRIVAVERAHGCVEQLLADAASYCRTHNIEPETAQIPVSSKGRLLAEADEWGADLVVLGYSPRRLLSKRVSGERTLHLVTNAKRPLFLG